MPRVTRQQFLTRFFRRELLDALKTLLSPAQIDTNGETRLRHGHGHTQEEMYAIKYAQLGRIPDVVVYPESEEQVTKSGRSREEARRHADSVRRRHERHGRAAVFSQRTAIHRFRGYAADESHSLDRSRQHAGMHPGRRGGTSHHGRAEKVRRDHGARARQR